MYTTLHIYIDGLLQSNTNKLLISFLKPTVVFNIFQESILSSKHTHIHVLDININ